MTDEDRCLLGLLHDLNLACGPFGLAVVEDSLSRDDELTMAYRFVHVADRILLRACSAAVPRVIEEAEGDGGGEPIGQGKVMIARRDIVVTLSHSPGAAGASP